MMRSHRIRGVALAGTLLVWLTAEATGQAVRSRDDVPINARALSLQQMARSADRIFQGKVRDVQTEEVTFKSDKTGREVNSRVRVTTFDVEKVFKADDGELEAGEPLTIRQLQRFSKPVEPGEEVLFYLDEESSEGFATPLGVYSGHFNILTNEDTGAKVAQNLLNNRGLWSTEQPLINSMPELNRGALTARVREETQNESRLTAVLRLASEPSRPGPVPLELITSVTETLVSEDDN